MLEDQGATGGSPVDEVVTVPESPLGLDMDEPILMKENVRLGPF